MATKVGMTRRTRKGEKCTPTESQQNKVIRWSNTGLSVGFSGLPPSAADIRHFQDFMFAETNFVGIFRIGIVGIYRFCLVRVFCWRRDFVLTAVVPSNVAGRRVAKPSLGRAAVFWAGTTTRITWHWRRRFEAVELGRSVHLGCACRHRVWARTISRRHGSVTVCAAAFLVEGERIDKAAMRSLRRRSKVEYPHDLFKVSLVWENAASARRSTMIDLQWPWTWGWTRQLQLATRIHLRRPENWPPKWSALSLLKDSPQPVTHQRRESHNEGSETYCYPIDETGVRTKNDGDTHNTTKHVGDRPPRVIRIICLDIWDDWCDTCDQPRELKDWECD